MDGKTIQTLAEYIAQQRQRERDHLGFGHPEYDSAVTDTNGVSNDLDNDSNEK